MLFLVLLAVFLVPIAVRAVAFALDRDAPRNYAEADWSSMGSLPPAAQFPEARVLIMSGRTGGWKGVVSVHSWIVIKRAGARSWTRSDVVGWGNPLKINGWAPDGRWFGDRPRVIADIRGADADRLIPRVERAVKAYQYRNAGDYRIWPGPNSNSFVAAVLRAIPEVGVTMPANAIGRDFRPGFYVGWSDSGTGFEINLWGYLGAKLGWVEGVELNFLGLVVGFDIRHPGLKLPGFGHIGLGNGLALAADPAKS